MHKKLPYCLVWLDPTTISFLIAIETEESRFKLPPVEEPVNELSFARIGPEFEESLPEMFQLFRLKGIWLRKSFSNEVMGPMFI